MNQPTPKRENQYAKYSGMGFQMLITIGLGTYLGVKLDEWQQNHTPVWTLVLSLASIAAAMYNFIRQLPKPWPIATNALWFHLFYDDMLRTLIFTACLGIVLFAAKYFAVGRYLPVEKWHILFFYFSLAALQHRLMSYGWANNREKFVQFYMATVVVRLLVCSAFVGIFLYLGVVSQQSFIITFFAFYLCYTCFEIYGMIRNLRRNSG